MDKRGPTVTTHTVLSIAGRSGNFDDAAWAATSSDAAPAATEAVLRRHPSPASRDRAALAAGRSSRSRSPPARGGAAANGATRSQSHLSRSRGGGAGHGGGGAPHGAHGGHSAGGYSAAAAELDKCVTWAAWLRPTRLDREVALNALAVAGASMADPLMSLVDTAMVGRIGTAPLAALGSNGALFNCLFFLFFTALAVICTQAMAQAHARGDLAAVGRGFAQALAAMAAVSAGLLLLLTSAPEAVLGMFATNKEMMADARTYLEIRALGLPAALFMCVSQAAFRSLLDLRTPFLVVCVSNASNYLLDELFMFRMGGGMAGCGWASVASQYLGAALFALLIWRRRDFGLREALDAAAEAAAHHGSNGAIALVIQGSAKRYSGGGGGPDRDRDLRDRDLGDKRSRSGDLAAAAAGGEGSDAGAGPGGGGAANGSGHHGGGGLTHRHDLGGSGGGGGRVSSGSGGGHGSGPERDAPSPRRTRGGAGSRGGGGAGAQGGGGGSRGGSKGAGGAARGMPLRRKVAALLWYLPWRPFLKRFAGLSIRGCLILSTYTSASVVAARAGTAVIAGHQVVQQHQQLQMSVAWSFLHVAQSMVANLYHSPGGPRAARRLAARIVLMSALYCAAAAALTLSLASRLPRVFTRDGAVLALVRSAEAPAGLMMALAWCNCLEGCLLAADDSAYVVRTYPFAAGAALLQLAATGLLRPLGFGTLAGIWWGLCLYYAVLLVAFGARCAWRAKRIDAAHPARPQD